MNFRDDAGRGSELSDLLADVMLHRGVRTNETINEALELFCEQVLSENRNMTLNDDDLVTERTFSCPCCGETNVVSHESTDEAVVIQDCEVCCRTIQLSFRDDGIPTCEPA